MNFWVIVILAGIVTAVAGIIIGWPTLRLRGDYLAIVTLGFGEIIPDVFRNADQLARADRAAGAAAVHRLPARQPHRRRARDQAARPARLRHQHQRRPTGGFLPDRFSIVELKPWYFTIVIMVLITIFVIHRLQDSKMGRAWVAVREDEVAASAMGVPLMRTKLWAYAIGAIFGGFAGGSTARSSAPSSRPASSSTSPC